MALIRRCIPLIGKTLKITPVILHQNHYIHRWVAPVLRKLKIREQKAGGKKTNPRNTFLEWNLEAELFAFGKRLNEEFDQDLLLQAFTDRSYVIKEEVKQKEMEFEVSMKDNRELSEEGEQFMNQYIQRYLDAVLPKFPLEGVAAIKRHLLSEAVLSNISLHLGTKDIILAAEYPVDNYTLCTVFKAIVGTLLRTSGEEKAAYFVRDFVITQLQGQDINEYWHIEDPYTLLTNLLKQGGMELESRLIGETAKNTLLACYRVGLYVDKKMVSAGFGEKVSIAKDMAAREALKKIFGTEDNMKPISFQISGTPKIVSKERYQITAS